MVYYPLSTLMLAGIRDILIITTPEDARPSPGCSGTDRSSASTIGYAVQPEPDGLARAFVHRRGSHRQRPGRARAGRQHLLRPGPRHPAAAVPTGIDGGAIFAYRVSDPTAYGVVEFAEGRAISIEEKPAKPR